MYKPVDPKANFPAQEEEVLSFWKEKDIFKKSIAQRKDSQGNTYTQVAASVREPQTLQRELCPLQAMRDNYPKFLLTLDDDPESDYQGILRRNALQWLVEG